MENNDNLNLVYPPPTPSYDDRKITSPSSACPSTCNAIFTRLHVYYMITVFSQ